MIWFIDLSLWGKPYMLHVDPYKIAFNVNPVRNLLATFAETLDRTFCAQGVLRTAHTHARG